MQHGEQIDTLAVSFQQVVHPVLSEEAGVAKLQHLLGGPDERSSECPADAARVQAVVATAACAALSSSSKASAGVLQPRVFRGLLLRAIATAARSSALCALRSVPFGKYWRSSPLVFSFVPRCQGLWGSQK